MQFLVITFVSGTHDYQRLVEVVTVLHEIGLENVTFVRHQCEPVKSVTNNKLKRIRFLLEVVVTHVSGLVRQFRRAQQTQAHDVVLGGVAIYITVIKGLVE